VQMTGNRHNLSVEGSFHSVLLFWLAVSFPTAFLP
jgi:hypothetical protein